MFCKPPNPLNTPSRQYTLSLSLLIPSQLPPPTSTFPSPETANFRRRNSVSAISNKNKQTAQLQYLRNSQNGLFIKFNTTKTVHTEKEYRFTFISLQFNFEASKERKSKWRVVYAGMLNVAVCGKSRVAKKRRECFVAFVWDKRRFCRCRGEEWFVSGFVRNASFCCCSHRCRGSCSTFNFYLVSSISAIVLFLFLNFLILRVFYLIAFY